MRKLEKRELIAHGIIVTLYEESSRVRSRPQKIKTSDSKKTTRSSVIYDRRAELLAYVHQLRNVGPQRIHQDHNTPTTDSYQPKPKKRRKWFGRLKALKFSFRRLFRREKKKAWKYENIEAIGGENIHRSSCPYRYRCQGRNRWSTISKRLRRVLKQFSHGCKCGKRFKHNDEQLQDLNRP